MDIAIDQYFTLYGSYKYIKQQFVTPKILEIEKDISREKVISFFGSNKTRSKAKKILSKPCVECKVRAKFFVFCTKRQNKGLFTFDYVPMTIDHIIPKCYGGNDHQVNMQIMCGLCNSLKSNTFDVQKLLGKKVRRFNGALFQSGNTVNTILSVFKNENGLWYFKFQEDNSILRCVSCVVL